MQPRTFTFRRQHAGLVVGLVLAGLMAVSATPVRADDAKKPAKKEAKKKPDFPPFDEVTKDCTLIDGFFPLYFNAKTDRLLAVIPANLIGTDFLMARSVNSGGRLTGYQFGHALVRWERFKKKMMLVEPELRHLRDKKSPVRDVIDRTYTDSVVLATPIVTLRGGDPVIDLDAIFKRNPDGNTRVFGGSLDASLSKWVKKKAFADNLELAVEGVFMGRNGGTKATLHYSISRLPKNGYEPREADDRIGYFMTARKDWTTPHDAPTTFKRYIHRWWLRKAEPDQAVSDVHPNDQIVFYIEKTVPVKFRRYIREGILLWNSAFEKAGIRNAIAVRQQTDSNEFAGLDPEDVNYNFFRWIVSGRAFAMGPSRANPLTGQILDADIIMDDSMARVWYDRYDRMMAQGTGRRRRAAQRVSRRPSRMALPEQLRQAPARFRRARSGAARLRARDLPLAQADPTARELFVRQRRGPRDVPGRRPARCQPQPGRDPRRVRRPMAQAGRLSRGRPHPGPAPQLQSQRVVAAVRDHRQ
jgi:hypothetical protein